ncbi:MAG: hypothetical protein NTY38_32590, partial [Acidobacteria bacterium]|nr:hypothetical protein [Acidobacteriota bacterium]
MFRRKERIGGEGDYLRPESGDWGDFLAEARRRGGDAEVDELEMGFSAVSAARRLGAKRGGDFLAEARRHGGAAGTR